MPTLQRDRDVAALSDGLPGTQCVAAQNIWRVPCGVQEHRRSVRAEVTFVPTEEPWLAAQKRAASEHCDLCSVDREVQQILLRHYVTLDLLRHTDKHRLIKDADRQENKLRTQSI